MYHLDRSIQMVQMEGQDIVAVVDHKDIFVVDHMDIDYIVSFLLHQIQYHHFEPRNIIQKKKEQVKIKNCIVVVILTVRVSI